MITINTGLGEGKLWIQANKSPLKIDLMLQPTHTEELYIHIYISGTNTRQGTNYTATSLPSQKLSKLDEPDMQDTAGETGTSS